MKTQWQENLSIQTKIVTVSHRSRTGEGPWPWVAEPFSKCGPQMHVEKKL